MKLLVCTQVVDADDPFLSFFVEWLRAFAQRFEHIHVVCLKEGVHELPHNVTIQSLGKESMGKTPTLFKRIVYTARLKMYAWKLRHEYDAVFVHMNQEYVLIAGALWTLLRKPIYLWRNHYAGNVLTDIAAALSTKVFCTSKHSYTAKFKKTVIMPVGIDTDVFTPQPVPRVPRSILFYGRMAPSKNPHMLLDALILLAKRGVDFTAVFRGTPLPKDAAYADELKKRAKDSGIPRIAFEPGLPHREGPHIFSAAEIFVNLGGSGMYDKMIFEAAACGALVVASSRDFAELVDPRFSFEAGNVDQLADKLSALLSLGQDSKSTAAKQLREIVVHQHSLGALAKRLATAMQTSL